MVNISQEITKYIGIPLKIGLRGQYKL